MSDGAMPTPPGWYPDPSGSGAHRWWDGIAWTGQVAPPSPPYGPTPAASVPDGTPVSTPWIWLIALLPVVQMLPLFLVDTSRMFPTDFGFVGGAPTAFTLIGDPWYLAAVATNWIVIGLVVWFSSLDHAALGRLGYPRRFHWAWSFLSVFSPLVYPIGRSIVVHRQAARGYGPMWAAIAVTVVSVVLAFVWAVQSVIAAVEWSTTISSMT